jgi:hypothetical protein
MHANTRCRVQSAQRKAPPLPGAEQDRSFSSRDATVHRGSLPSSPQTRRERQCNYSISYPMQSILITVYIHSHGYFIQTAEKPHTLYIQQVHTSSIAEVSFNNINPGAGFHSAEL